MNRKELLTSDAYDELDLNEYKWLEQAIEISKRKKQNVEIANSINTHIALVQDGHIEVADAIDMVAHDVANIMRK